MTVYRNQAADDQTAQQVQQFDTQSGLTPLQARMLAESARTYPEVPAGTQVAAVQSGAPQPILDAANERAQANVEIKKPKKKKGLLQKAAGLAGDAVGGAASNIAKTADFLTPKPVEQALNPIGDVVKPVVRGGFIALDLPLQTVVGAARSAYGVATGSYHPNGVGDFADDVFDQTTFGQVVNDIQANQRVDVGSGFFAGAAEFDEQGNPVNTEARRTKFERSVASVGNSAWTPGRWAATDVFQFQPGSVAYDITSALADGAVALFGDPSSAALKKAAEGSRAASLGSRTLEAASVERAARSATPEWRKTVEQGLGLVEGTYKSPRQSVLTSQTGKFLYSDRGRDLVVDLANDQSPSEIWKRYGKKFPIDLANDLAKTNDPAGVVNLLADRLVSDVRFLPSQGGVADRVVRSRQANGRLWNLVPDTRIDWADPESAIRNVDNALANANIHGAARSEILDKWVDTLTNKNGPVRQRRFEAMDLFESTLEAQLTGHGVPADVASDITRYTKRTQNAVTYGIDEFAKGIEFAPGDGPGPLMVTQLMNTGYHLYDPAKIRQVREATINNRILNFVANSKTWRLPNSMVGALQDELWKPLTLIRPAFLSKLLPEGMARINFGGAFEHPLDYIFTMFDRRSKGILGQELSPLTKQADKLVEEENAWLKIRYSATDDVTKDEARKALSEITSAKQALDEQAAQKFDTYAGAMGRGQRNALWDEAGQRRQMAQQIRQGNQQIVNKDQFPELWTQGNADQILQMASDPVAKRVANGGLLEGDTLPDHIAKQLDGDLGRDLGTRAGLEGVVAWLHAGGKQYLDEMAAANPGLSRNRVARRMVYGVRDNLLYRTGGDMRLLDAIATGAIDGEDIGYFSRIKSARRSPSDALLGIIDDVRDNNPNVSAVTSHWGQVIEGSKGGRDLDRFKELRDTVVDAFFQGAYARGDDFLNRSPAWRGAYYRRVEELLPHMAPEEAQRALEAAAETVPKTQMERMVKAVGKAAGDLTAEDVNKLAGHAAMDDVQKLMFDSSQKSQLFDVLRVAMPFGEAWREILTSYSRLLMKNPRTIRRFQQGVNAARGSGFFSTNEYGEEQYQIPLSGPLLNVLTGGRVKADLTGSVEGLSLGTQLIPGVGPTAGFVAAKFIPDEPSGDWARRVLFPYGEPKSLELLPVPAWLQKVTQGAGWSDGATAASTKNQTMNVLAATGEYGTSREEQARLIADADAAARGVLVARGLAQAISPSAPMVRYTAETPNGDVLAAKLGDEFRKLQAEEGYDAATREFLDKYGIGAALYLVGNTKSTQAGLDASQEFGEFERKNGWLFDQHSEIAGYFGPHPADGNFDYATYVRQIEAGQRERLSPNERLAAANQLIGDMVVQEQVDRMPPRAKWSDSERAYVRSLKDEVAGEYPGYTPYPPMDLNARNRQINGLIEAAADPRISDEPVSSAVLEYAAARDEALAKAKARGRAGFDTSKDTADLRQWLTLVGSELSDQTPAFATVWDRLLSREVEEPDDN